MKWYNAKSGYSMGIQEVEIDKETDQSVWIKGRRNAKRSSYDNFFPTYEEAYVFIHGKVCEEIEKRRQQLKWAEDKLEEVELLKFPKPHSTIMTLFIIALIVDVIGVYPEMQVG